MRILTRKIYRAFPELDEYNDERCLRFLNAAKGGKVRSWLRGMVMLLFGALATSVPWSAATWILRRYVYDYASTASQGLLSNPDVVDGARVVLGVLGAVIGPVVAFLVRDLLLRRRVRFVLRSRGVCMNCKYSLVGLPVGVNNAVICSECGTQSKVDAALGELVTDEAGRRLFRPGDAQIAPLIRWLTDARVKAIKRWSIRSLIALVAIALPAAGAYEGFLRWQASVAARERPGAAAYLAYIEKAQPANGRIDTPNAWDLLDKIMGRLREADAECPPEPIMLSTGQPLYIYFGDIYSRDESNNSDRKEEFTLSRFWSLRRLEEYKEHGIFDLLQEFAQCERAVRQFPWTPTQPIAATIWSGGTFGDSRTLARIGAARMALAQQNHDLEEYCAALRANLVIGRNLMIQGSSLDTLLAVAIDGLTLGRVGAVLEASPKPEWIDAIERELLADAPRVSASYIYGAQQLIDLDTISWCFEDPSRVRFGGQSKALESFLPSTEKRGRLGSYASNRDQYTALSRALSATSELPPHARASGTAALPSFKNAELAESLAPDLRLAQSIDIATTQRAGIVVWIALERYRVAHGSYPRSLDQITTPLPVDPFSGKPFLYRKSDPDRRTRPDRPIPPNFLLYSIGFNRVDDGGQSSGGAPQPDQVINPSP